MLRTCSGAVLWMAMTAAACQAQIVSNPVVTSWPTGMAVSTYPVPTAPVAADVCTPPVVTFCNPCAVASPPGTSLLVPSPTAVPVTAYRWPGPTVRRPVVTSSVPGSVTRVYRPVWQPVSPTVPVWPTPAPIGATAPVTSYYAPSAVPMWSSPVSPNMTTTVPANAGGGCHCQGR